MDDFTVTSDAPTDSGELRYVPPDVRARGLTVTLVVVAGTVAAALVGFAVVRVNSPHEVVLHPARAPRREAPAADASTASAALPASAPTMATQPAASAPRGPRPGSPPALPPRSPSVRPSQPKPPRDPDLPPIKLLDED